MTGRFQIIIKTNFPNLDIGSRFFDVTAAAVEMEKEVEWGVVKRNSF